MTDIARLGYAVDSSQLSRATRELDKNTRSANKASTATEKLEREANKMGKAWGVFAGLGISAGLIAATRVLINATKAAADFQQAMAEVSTLLSNTSGIEKVSKEVRELTKQFGGNAQSQAKALYQIISAGASNTAEAMDILTTANKLAIGGVTDVATAADGLTSIMNAYAGEAGSAKDISDALFVAMRGGKTTIGELSAAVGQVAPIAATAGVSFDELSAAIAAVTTGGVQTSVAVTNLRALIAAVVKPSSEAVEISKKLGLEFNLAGLRAKGLAGFLDDVRQKTGGSQEIMAKLFGGVESLGAVFALTGGQAKTFTGLLEDQAQKAGQTEEAYAKMADTGVQKYARLKAVAADALIEVGNQLLNNTDAVDGLTESLNNPDLIKGLTEVVRLLVEAGNAAVTAAGKIGQFIGAYKDFLSDRGFTPVDDNSSTKQVEARLKREREILEQIEGGRTIWGEETAQGLRESIANAERLLAYKQKIDSLGSFEEGEIARTRGSGQFANVLGTGERAPSSGIPAIDPVVLDVGTGAVTKRKKATEELTAAEKAWLELQKDMAAIQDVWNEGQLDAILREQDRQDVIRKGIESTDLLIKDMEFELELITMSNEQRAIAIAQRYADANATDEQRQRISELAVETLRIAEAENDRIDAMDGVRNATRGFLYDLKEGEGIVGSLEKAFDSLLDTLFDIAAQNIAESLFGPQGTSGGGVFGDWLGGALGALTGTSASSGSSSSGSMQGFGNNMDNFMNAGASGGGGGGWADIAASVFGSLFGGGRAYGGDVRGGRIYRMGEGDRPELLNLGRGRQYVIPGDSGRVEPIRSDGGAPGMVNNISISVEGQVDMRSRSRIASDIGREMANARRNA